MRRMWRLLLAYLLTWEMHMLNWSLLVYIFQCLATFSCLACFYIVILYGGCYLCLINLLQVYSFQCLATFCRFYCFYNILYGGCYICLIDLLLNVYLYIYLSRYKTHAYAHSRNLIWAIACCILIGLSYNTNNFSLQVLMNQCWLCKHYLKLLHIQNLISRQWPLTFGIVFKLY